MAAWFPVTSPKSAPVKFVAVVAVVALPVTLPLNVPVVVPPSVNPEASWELPTAPLAIVESVKASVLRVGLPELLVRKRFVPSNSTEPKTGVVRLMPVANFSGADVALPAGSSNVPVKIGLAAVALRLMLPLSLLMAVRIVSVARIAPELPAA